MENKEIADKKIQTTNTYNESAEALASKFDSLGARMTDINETFLLVEKENPAVLEIGCGNGRDAAEIVKHTSQYTGVDISEKLIELAHKKVPEATFQVTDIEQYEFPKNLDIVFAFASLIHVPKESLKTIFGKLHESLNPGGVIRLSLKHSDQYTQVTKEDEFGIRTYYHYSLQDIEEIAEGFTFLKSETTGLRGQTWLEIILQK